MVRKIFIAMAMVVATLSYAQEGTASPYSFTGLGELKFKGTVENRTMGGLSVFGDSIHLNLNNPAAFSELKLTTYAIGVDYSTTRLNAASGSDNTTAASVNYLAVGIPAGKFSFGFGLLPFTSVGYRLQSTNDDETITNLYQGEGGVNKVFLSLGYQIVDGLSVGATGNYNFGNIRNQNTRVIQDVQYATREDNRSDLRGLDFKFAVNYKKLINSKNTLYASVLFTPKYDLSSENSRTVAVIPTFDQQPGGDSEDIDLGVLRKTDLTLPSSFTVGLGYGENKKWFVGLDYTTQKTSDFENVLVNLDNVTYEDASKISIGGFYIPKYDSFSSYWSRITYRAGLRIEKTGLNINGESINDFGMSFGLGLPVRGFSNVNIGFELGQRGTNNAGLIKENYFNLRLSLSLNDKWFQKSKYN